MANTYKNKGASLTATTLTTVYTCPSATVAIVMKINCANTDVSTDTSVSVSWSDASASADFFLCKGTILPMKSSLKVGDEEPIILEAGDTLKVQAGDANKIDVTLAILEIS